MGDSDPKKIKPEEIQQVFNKLKTENEDLRHALEMQNDKVEFLSAIIDNALDMITLIDPMGNITFAGKAHKILGYEPDFLIGKNVMDFMHPDDLPKIIDAHNELTGSGHPRRIEYRCRCQDGTYLWIETRGTVFKYDNRNEQKILLTSRDITERKQAEELLRKSEEKYRLLVENLNDVFYTLDENAKITYVSPTVESISGYAPAELIGKHYIDFVHPDDKEGRIEQFLKILSGIKEPSEYRFVTKDKRIIWVRTSGRPLLKEGCLAGVHGVLTDITERKQVEEALRESEKLLDMFFSQSLSGFFFMMLDEPIEWHEDIDKEKTLDYVFSHQRMTKVNQAMLDQYGAKEEDFLGLTPGDLFGHDLEHGRYIWKGLFDRGRWHVETQERRLDGTPIIIDGDYICLYDKQGRVIGHFGVQEEITSRKKAEQALIKNKNILHAISRMAQIGGWGKNLLTGEDEWSEVTREIHEVGPDFIPDMQNAIEFYKKGPSRDKIVDVVTRCIETGDPYDVEVEFITARGRARWVRTMGQAEFQEGQCVRLFGTIQDITERKQVEAEKEALEVRNRQLKKAESLSRMAGAIAHQFNNKLQAVMGNIELAMDDLPRGAKILGLLEGAINASLKAGEISGQMLMYLGQATDRYEALDLSEIYRESLSLLRAGAPKNIHFKADFSTSSLVILGNAFHIKQVLSNLVINAWEATGQKKSTIRLNLKKVSGTYIAADKRFPVDWQPKPISYACLEVADEGHGIEDRDIEKIFDPFFSTKFTGRGLGLSVLMGIVQAHYGGVTVESEPGRGSIFRVFLPLSNERTTCRSVIPEPPGTDKPENSFQMEASGKILLVEDEEQVRKLITAMLTRLGYTVLEAKDGLDAVKIFKQHQHEICCVLCDLIMPRMDGWETLATLRELSPDIPVILSSGYDEAEVMAGEHSEQPNAFLSKPYQQKDLVDKIERVLR